jgi:hypothetical protein
MLAGDIFSTLDNPSEGVKKTSTSVKPKGRVDWRSFRAQPLEIEARCRKLT